MPHPLFPNLRSLLVLLLLLCAAGTANADAGKDLFEKQCSSCHTIGGGDGGGPDLKGVGARRSTQWLVRMITEPDKLSAEKDATQAELVKKFGMEMPNLGVSREDAQKIAAFLAGGSAPAAAGAAAPGAPAAAPAGEAKTAEAPKAAEVAVTPELLATGRDLFTGKTRFANGGAPCVSCHSLSYPSVNGGALAADLSGIYQKMGENGVRGVLKGLSFPVMKKIYADRKLTDEEMTALSALFKEQSTRKEPVTDPYPVAGLGFFGLCIVALIMFKRRIR